MCVPIAFPLSSKQDVAVATIPFLFASTHGDINRFLTCRHIHCFSLPHISLQVYLDLHHFSAHTPHLQTTHRYRSTAVKILAKRFISTLLPCCAESQSQFQVAPNKHDHIPCQIMISCPFYDLFYLPTCLPAPQILYSAN